MPLQSVYKEWEDGKGILYSWFQSLHTRIDLIVADKDESSLKSIAAEIQTELDKLTAIANFYDSSSELYQLNENAILSPVQVSDELFLMLSDCLSLHTKTLGYFDISIKSDNFYPGIISEVELCDANNTIRFNAKGIKLDLSGYLKGYALEKIRSIISKYQIKNTLINLGNSSVLALGNHPHGSGWKVAYGHPVPTGKETCLENECLTTSGNEMQGRRHIINPLTGQYVEGKKQLSVITQRGTDGEALSTALFIVPSNEEREKIIDNFTGIKIIS